MANRLLVYGSDEWALAVLKNFLDMLGPGSSVAMGMISEKVSLLIYVILSKKTRMIRKCLRKNYRFNRKILSCYINLMGGGCRWDN